VSVTFTINDNGVGGEEYRVSDQSGTFSGDWQDGSSGTGSGSVAVSGSSGEVRTIKVQTRDSLGNEDNSAASGDVTIE
jgi:hypothetical protein